MLANAPALRPELQAVYPELQRLAEPVGPSGVKATLLPLLLVFSEKATEAESPMFWHIYATVLGATPAKALREAVRKWVAIGKWFPKPAELRELANEEAIRLRAAEYRARKVLAAPVPAPESYLPRAEVQTLVAEIKAAVSGNGDFAARRVGGDA